MYLGNSELIEQEDGKGAGGGNNLFILDGQNDEVLGHINKKHVIFNEHEQDLPTYRDTFQFTVLGDKRYAEHLGKRNGIIAPGEDGELLEFRIFEAHKYRDLEGLKVDVYSHATYLDLKRKKVFDPGKTNPETAQQHALTALDGTGWQLGDVAFKGIRTLEFDNPYNPYDYLRRIAREFELELHFYVTTDGQKVTGRYVDLVDRIGEFRGRTVEFGRDLHGIRRIEKTDNIVTALWVYGPEREDGTRLKVFVEDREARERWGKNGKEHLVDHYEPLTEELDITEERLEQLGETELAKRINAAVSYESDIVDLENVPGLEDKKIRFGDTIRVKDLKFNPPLYLEARIHNQRRDVFTKANKRVILGDYIEYTEEEVQAIWRQLRSQIRERLERLVLVSITSSAGSTFKNGIGSTELTARTFLSGNEVDEDGTKYEYRWHKFDKNGNYVPSFYEEGKMITVSADTIDEKASYRVEIIQGDEVLTVHEITLTSVFDGEDGAPGPPGPEGEEGPPGPPGEDGEDGQGVDDITPQYYLSNSDSMQSGGSWTDTKPNYQPNKYLWTRNKITYKNPTEIEYTTPVLDDSWKAIEIADNAMTSADGKNTVFRQSSTPPTTNRKIGDLWFKTNEGNKMYVWTGSWTETKLDHQALSVGKLSAISADLGNVTAGDITGVNITGATITQQGEGSSIVFNDEGITQYISGAIGVQISTENWHWDSFSPAMVKFYPETEHNYFAVAASAPGLGDGFIGFVEEADKNFALRTLNIRNLGGEINLSGNDINIGGNAIIFNNGEMLELQGVTTSYLGFYTDGTRRGYIGFGSPSSYDYFVRNEASGDLRLHADGGQVIIQSSTQNVLAGHTRFQRTRTATDRWNFNYTNDGFEITPSGTGWNNYGTLYLNRSGAMTRVPGDFAVDGSKSAIVQTDNFGERLMYAVEAPESRFMDVIEEILEEGEHWIGINHIFAETISDYSVIPFAEGGGSIKVIEKENKRFKVEVTGDGFARCHFIIYGRRKGYEHEYMKKIGEETE